MPTNSAPRAALDLQVVDHPLAGHKLTCLRDRDTPIALFRSTVRELGRLLAFAATADLPLASRAIQTPLAPMQAPWVDESRVMVVPVLRAGLPLADAFCELMPSAAVGHVGVYRDAQARPVEYLVKLPAPSPSATHRPPVVPPAVAGWMLRPSTASSWRSWFTSASLRARESESPDTGTTHIGFRLVLATE